LNNNYLNVIFRDNYSLKKWKFEAIKRWTTYWLSIMTINIDRDQNDVIFVWPTNWIRIKFWKQT
jgi:hypothetical protein